MKRKIFALGMLAVLTAGFSCQTMASPRDQLAQCLVAHTSESDRTMFAKWIFAQMALSPDVASMTNVSSDLRDQLNRQAGKLFTRLLAVDCRQQTALAYNSEGAGAIGYGFQILGQVAGRSLMQDPHVQSALSGFTKYLDKAKLKAVLGNAVHDATAGGDAKG